MNILRKIQKFCQEIFSPLNKNNSSNTMHNELKKEFSGKAGEKLEKLVLNHCNMLELTRNVPINTIKYLISSNLSGKRSEDTSIQIINDMPRLDKKTALSIAKTISNIIHAKRNQIRQENLGINWYVWRAVGGKSGDGRTRKSHRAMEGVLCRYDNPPSPEWLIGEKSIGTYHPGEIDDCRCYDEPLIDLEDIKFPRRVHIGGKLVKMTKKQFEDFAKI